MMIIYKSSTTCTLWSMFKNSTLFGTSFTFVKTAPKIRDLGRDYLEFCVLLNIDRSIYNGTSISDLIKVLCLRILLN